MWPLDKNNQEFQALSFANKLRVCRSLVRGEAPSDPGMAPAAIELAESYQRQGWSYKVLMRWLPWMMVVGTGYLAIPAAISGNFGMLTSYLVVVLLCVGTLLFDPATRPRNRLRSLVAARGVVTSGK